METHIDEHFEIFGYFKEYLIDGELIGTKSSDKPKDLVFGYESTKFETAEKDIVFKNKKIKKGQEYYTRTYPLCGKSKLKFKPNYI